MSAEKGVCNRCGQEFLAGQEPDPCLGEIPGVVGACCGHGKQHRAYIQWEDGMTVRGFRLEHHGRSKTRRNAN